MQKCIKQRLLIAGKSLLIAVYKDNQQPSTEYKNNNRIINIKKQSQ